MYTLFTNTSVSRRFNQKVLRTRPTRGIRPASLAAPDAIHKVRSSAGRKHAHKFGFLIQSYVSSFYSFFTPLSKDVPSHSGTNFIFSF